MTKLGVQQVFVTSFLTDVIGLRQFILRVLNYLFGSAKMAATIIADAKVRNELLDLLTGKDSFTTNDQTQLCASKYLGPTPLECQPFPFLSVLGN